MPTGYRRILIGSDLSRFPADIIEEIRKLAAHGDPIFPEEIHLAFVLEALQDIPIDLPMAGLNLLPVAEEALGRLNLIARDLGSMPTRISTGVYHGKADKILASLAAVLKFDLILVVSHGRPLINRLMTGSLPGSLSNGLFLSHHRQHRSIHGNPEPESLFKEMNVPVHLSKKAGGIEIWRKVKVLSDGHYLSVTPLDCARGLRTSAGRWARSERESSSLRA